MVLAHTDFTEVTRMVLIEIRSVKTVKPELSHKKRRDIPVVVHATSETTTSWVLAVLSYTTMTCGNMTAVLSGFRESGRHPCSKEE